MKKEHNNGKLDSLVLKCFNPCSNGMKKELNIGEVEWGGLLGFNPCSNGMKKEQKTKHNTEVVAELF